MSAVMLARPDAPPVLRTSRRQAAATWLFVLPLFTQGVVPDVVKAEVAGLGVLAFTWIASGRPLPHRGLERLYAAFAVLALIAISYVAFRSWPAADGPAASHDEQAALFVATYTVVAVFAALFFEERLFVRVIWRVATLALWAAIITGVASRLTGHVLLVNPGAAGLRMQGTLGEPSDWAPVLALVLLLALRRRSWLYVALSVAGLLLADSPTCIVVMAVSLPLYAALAGTWRHRGLLLCALCVIIPAAVTFILHANPQPYLLSSNPAEVAVGRLVSGVRNVQTDGQQGTNIRFSHATVTFAAARQNGWISLGAGPGAEETYFPAVYPGTSMGPNGWVTVLFDFGETGVAVLVLLLAAAAWRMRGHPEMAAILLPFFAALMINSDDASPPLVALAILLFAFGWAPRAAAGAGLGVSWRTGTRSCR